jgi:hypothetical protein
LTPSAITVEQIHPRTDPLAWDEIPRGVRPVFAPHRGAAIATRAGVPVNPSPFRLDQGAEAADIAALNCRVGALVIIAFVALNALLIAVAVRGG